MKFHINFDFKNKNEPWGGGNAFLNALKTEFLRTNSYEENILKADVIILNSHHKMRDIGKIKRLSKAKFSHRLAGPHSWRREGDKTDCQAKFIAEQYADMVIYQSKFSREAYGIRRPNVNNVIIHNASDPEFYFKPKIKTKNSRIRILIASWSDNMQKGYADVMHLDKNLDHNKYELIFAGRSPVEFKNVKNAGILPQKQLGELMRKCDMFFSPSLLDPCSNSLIQALTCGLPAVAANSGGHPELIKEGGLLYNNQFELLECINKVSSNIEYYENRIPNHSIQDVASKYMKIFL